MNTAQDSTYVHTLCKLCMNKQSTFTLVKMYCPLKINPSIHIFELWALDTLWPYILSLVK